MFDKNILYIQGTSRHEKSSTTEKQKYQTMKGDERELIFIYLIILV